jgi:hypothetical protein
MRLTKTVVAQVRYFETLYIIEDEKGERLFVGSEETGKRLLKLLKKQRPKVKRRKRK